MCGRLFAATLVGCLLAPLGVGSHPAPKPSLEIPDLSKHHGPRRPWTRLDVRDGPSQFHFAVITDNTGGARDGVFARGLDRLNLMRPAFVMSVGDLIEGYTRNRVALKNQWDSFQKMVSRLDVPFFFVAGNHDYTNVTMAELWRERFGASYYHFVYKDTLFIVLNSELFDLTKAPWWTDRRPYPHARAQKVQLSYLRSVLAANPKVRWTFVFLHQPFWRKPFQRKPKGPARPSAPPWPVYDYVPPDWRTIEGLLDDRDYTIFAGHQHTYRYSAEAGGPHVHEKIALATTGGVSRLRGVEYGEFDHVVWVTMTDKGPVIANLLLEGILDKRLEVPKQRPYWVE